MTDVLGAIGNTDLITVLIVLAIILAVIFIVRGVR